MSEMTHAIGPSHARKPVAAPRPWPLLVIAAPAAVAIWSGWVGLGGMCGFGPVNLLPGIGGGFWVNTAITLPIGVEAYGTYGLKVWLNPGTPENARVWARRSAIGALILGALGQVIYHLLAAAHAARAPWPVVVLVSCMPVATVAFAAALWHLTHAGSPAVEAAEAPAEAVEPALPQTAETGRSETAEADRKVTGPAVIAVQAPPRKPPARKKTAGRPAVRLSAVVARAEAENILAAEPDITAEKLAERVGRKTRWGETVKAEYKKKLAAAAQDPEE